MDGCARRSPHLLSFTPGTTILGSHMSDYGDDEAEPDEPMTLRIRRPGSFYPVAASCAVEGVAPQPGTSDG